MADRSTFLLVGGAIVALVLGAYELQREPSVPTLTSVQPTIALSLPEVPPDIIKSVAAYDAIIERPLFSRERLPTTDKSAPQSLRPNTGSDDIEGMRLSAVLKGPENLTILLEDRAGETRILHAGDKLGKWQIEEILDDRVVVVSAGRRKTLRVHHFGPAVTNKALRRQPSTAKSRLRRKSTRTTEARSSTTEHRSQDLSDQP